MKIQIAGLALALGLHLAVPVSAADLLVEPIGTWASGTITMKTVPAASTKIDQMDSFSGFHYGGRLGVRPGPTTWIAAQYILGSGEYTPAAAGAFADTKGATYERSVFSLQVGFDFSSPLRLWLGYVIKEELKMKTNGIGAFSGPGFQAGFGYRAARSVSLFVEYTMVDYNLYSANGFTASASTGFTTFRAGTTLAGISLIFGK